MKSGILNTFFSGALMVVLGSALNAADWPAYRGSEYDGSSPEKILLKWPADGPKQLWKIETPRGFSSFAVSGGKAFTLVQRTLDGAPREICLAVDAKTGKEVWAANVGPTKYDGSGNAGTPDNNGGDGPHSTPTVSEGRVYVFTPALVLQCLDAETGKAVWSKDIVREHQ